MGCKAVIAAGWAVDDRAANTFAQTFYAAMFAGRRFGRAVLQARVATWEQHRLSNTWGAFQAYGDERYRFPDTPAETAASGGPGHRSHLIADLDMLSARLECATDTEKRDFYRAQIEVIERSARGPHLRNAGAREGLARAWAELGEMERAIGHYRAALGMEDAGFSLKALEQLANLEIRHGAHLSSAADAGKRAAGAKYMDAGRARLELLLQIGPTAERLSLLASYWKRRAQVCAARGNRKGIRECLLALHRVYWAAVEHGYRQTGARDYYPLFNALDGALLLAVAGERGPLEAHAHELANLLQDGSDNARQRGAEHRELFHALAEIEAQRIDALWACCDGRDTGCITEPAVREHLATRYRDLLQSMGAAPEHDSATNQLRFLIDMLPSGDKGKRLARALRELVDDIGQRP